MIYELFFTNLPQQSFTVCDVVELYLHRGAFEPTLADEDNELDPDRWCSHSACGQECWQVIAQWVWNEAPGTRSCPDPTTCAHHGVCTPSADRTSGAERNWLQRTDERYPPRKAGRFTGKDFSLQPDGSLRCPAGKSLFCGERRSEADGSLRLVYEARIADCRACPLREQCQWHGKEAKHPRRVSLLLHPRKGGSAPLLWRDWPRREHRRACMKLLRQQRVEVCLPPALPPEKARQCDVLTRAERAHYRLDWQTRLFRNARSPEVAPPTMTLHGVPDHFALFLGLQAA